MSNKLQLRRDTAANWEAAKQPALAQGEIGLILDNNGKVVGLKIGDGETEWKELPDRDEKLAELEKEIFGQDGSEKDIIADLEITQGLWVGESGAIGSYASWFITQPYLLKKGHTIDVETGAGKYTSIAITDKTEVELGDSVVPVKDDSGNKLTAYTATDDDVYVILSGEELTKAIDSVKGYSGHSQKIADITRSVEEITKKVVGDAIEATVEGKVNNRVSIGLQIPNGAYKLSVNVASGTDADRWRLYRYTNGEMGSVLIDYHNFGEEVDIVIPDGDDGVWFFTEKSQSGARVYTFNFSDSSSINALVTKHDKDLAILDERITHNTEVATSAFESIITIDYDAQVSGSVQWVAQNLNLSGEIYCLIENMTLEASAMRYAYTTDGENTQYDNLYLGRNRTIFKLLDKNTGRKIIALIFAANAVEKAGNIRISFLSAKRAEMFAHNKCFGKNIVCFGDSITEFVNQYTMKGYVAYLADISQAHCVNGGIGGMQLCQRDTLSLTPNENQAKAAFDISNLVRAWSTNDWSYQDSAISAGVISDTSIVNACNRAMANLKTIDIMQTDIITIFGGTNDYTADNQIGESTDSDNTTIKGALNRIVDDLLSANPKLQIYIITPIIRWFSEIADKEHSSDRMVALGRTDGKMLPDIVDAIEDAAKHNHIPCLNWYWTLGFNEQNWSKYFHVINDRQDYTHPYGGFDVMAEKLMNFINAH